MPQAQAWDEQGNPVTLPANAAPQAWDEHGNPVSLPATKPQTGPGIAQQAKESQAALPASQSAASLAKPQPLNVLGNTVQGLESEGRGLVSGARGVGDVVGGAARMIAHPIDTAAEMGNRMISEGGRAVKSARAGNYGDAATAAMMVNPIAPMIEAGINTARADPARAAGQALGTMLLGKVGEVAGENPVVQGAARDLAQPKRLVQNARELRTPVVPVEPEGIHPASRIAGSYAPLPNAAYDFGRDPAQEAARAIQSGAVSARTLPEAVKNFKTYHGSIGSQIGQAVEGADQTSDIPVSGVHQIAQDAARNAISPGPINTVATWLKEHFPNETMSPTELWNGIKKIDDQTKFKEGTQDEMTRNAVLQQARSHLRGQLEARVPEIVEPSGIYSNLHPYIDALEGKQKSMMRAPLPFGEVGAPDTAAKLAGGKGSLVGLAKEGFQRARGLTRSIAAEDPTEWTFNQIRNAAGFPARAPVQVQPWARSLPFPGGIEPGRGPLFEGQGQAPRAESIVPQHLDRFAPLQLPATTFDEGTAGRAGAPFAQPPAGGPVPRPTEPTPPPPVAQTTRAMRRNQLLPAPGETAVQVTAPGFVASPEANLEQAQQFPGQGSLKRGLRTNPGAQPTARVNENPLPEVQRINPAEGLREAGRKGGTIRESLDPFLPPVVETEPELKPVTGNYSGQGQGYSTEDENRIKSETARGEQYFMVRANGQRTPLEETGRSDISALNPGDKIIKVDVHGRETIQHSKPLYNPNLRGNPIKRYRSESTR